MRGRGRLSTLFGAVLVAGALAIPTAALATVTIGSNLADAPNNTLLGPGTWAPASVPAALQAPGGLTSPVNGVITTWRIRIGTGANIPLTLRVIRPLSGNLFLGAGTGPSELSYTTNSINVYSASLPIAIGDRIGNDSGVGNTFEFRTVAGPSTDAWFSPPLADSGTGRAPQNVHSDFETLVNADIQPTATFTVDKVKKLKGGKLQVNATVPNPGILQGGSTSLLKTTSISVSAPGQATLKLKPTKSAKSMLKSRANAKVKVQLSFTPTGGTASTQLIKAKIHG